MSICSVSANFLAPTVGRTWNPMIIASDADAKLMSASEIAPTPLSTIFTWISGVDKFCRASESASIDPSTSPLTIIFNSLKSPIAKRRPISSSVMCLLVRRPCSLYNCSRLAAIDLASFSSSNTWNLSPALGAPLIPNIDNGCAGPATFKGTPCSSCIALTRP